MERPHTAAMIWNKPRTIYHAFSFVIKGIQIHELFSIPVHARETPENFKALLSLVLLVKHPILVFNCIAMSFSEWYLND